MNHVSPDGGSSTLVFWIVMSVIIEYSNRCTYVDADTGTDDSYEARAYENQNSASQSEINYSAHI